MTTQPRPAADPPLLSIDDLRVEIALPESTVHALDGVSLELRAGETLGVVGESGCGKTMTALSVLRLLPPGGRITGGRISLLDTDLTSLSAREMRRVRGNLVGMISQDPMRALNPTMTIGAQVSETVRLHRDVSKRQALARAVEVLELVGLARPGRVADEYPFQLSGGMQQRVAIAMALACEPRILIADEPTTALDVTIQGQILALLDDLRETMGMSVLLVTHDLGVVAGHADRVAVMYAGRVVETTDTTTLFDNFRHPYTQALLSGLPENARDRNQRLYSIPGLPPDLTAPPAGCRFAPRCRAATLECGNVDPQLTGSADHLWACIHPVGRDRATHAGGSTVSQRGPEPRPAAVIPRTDPFTPREPGEVLLEVDRLVKDFPITKGAVLQRRVGAVSAVADVTFGVERGTTFGLVGESGCGKSTLGRLIVGLDSATSGAVRIDGVDHTKLGGSRLKRARRDVQLMFQDPYSSLDPRMRVGTTLLEPLVVQGIGTRREQHKAVLELLDRVGLPAGAVSRYPHEFSGGQRQRIGLARALALNPRLVVADEPVSALDVSIQAQILNLLRDLQATQDLTYVFISHDLSVVRYVSDVIAVMYLGRIVEMGPAESVLLRPHHPYTRGLLDSAPVADPAVDRAKSSGVTGELPSASEPPSGCRFRTRCPRAEQICSIEEPPLRPLLEGEHVAACHFPLNVGATVTV